jgi:hypothetical protein
MMGTERLMRRDDARQNGNVNILSSFGVPFGEVEGKLLLDTDSLRQQLDIVVKAQPKLRVVGWCVIYPVIFSWQLKANTAVARSRRYATHPALNSWTPLIHDEYATLTTSSQNVSAAAALTAPSAAPVHLTLDVDNLQMKAYASSKLGLGVDASSNRTFVPLRTEMKAEKSEHGGCEQRLTTCRVWDRADLTNFDAHSERSHQALSTSPSCRLCSCPSFHLATRSSPRLATRHAHRCLEHARQRPQLCEICQLWFSAGRRSYRSVPARDSR